MKQHDSPTLNSTFTSPTAILVFFISDSPVNFYAYLSSETISPSVNAPIVFNVVQEHTDSAYSKTTGVFTAPLNGTYYFTTGITGQTNVKTYAAITVRGQKVTSLFAFDDYQLSQSSASVVVQLYACDEVVVVKRSGLHIYGSSKADHISYFMGMLLW